MILILLFFVLWWVLAYLCDSLLVAVALHLSTALALAVFLAFGWNWLRVSRLSVNVARFLGVRFTHDGALVLQQLDARRQIFFACSPHGTASLPLCLFAGHGACRSDIPSEIAERTAIMGHWLLLLLPGVCQFFQLYGVVFSARSTVESALDRGMNIALCPSGMLGKTSSQFSIDTMPDPMSQKIPIYIPRRERIGFLFLAAKRKALVVPVLSRNEDYLFTDAFPSITALARFISQLTNNHWFVESLAAMCVTPVGGRWLIKPRFDVEIQVGAPIDAALFDPSSKTSMATLEKQYCSSLKALEGRVHKVIFT